MSLPIGAYIIGMDTLYKATVIGTLASILAALVYIVWWVSN